MATSAPELTGVEQVNIQQLEQGIKVQYEQRFEVWKAKELANLQEQQNATIADEIQKLYKKIQDEQKPLTKEAIQQLVDQEYAEIKVRLFVSTEDGTPKEEVFILRELPQSIERKFYRSFTKRLKDKGSELEAFTQRVQGETFEKQLMAFLETFDGAFDVLTDAALLILNPFGKRKDVTADWISDNVSSNRLYSIILAQVEVNKLRDFFSRLFQSGQKAGTMMTSPNLQQLRQLAL